MINLILKKLIPIKDNKIMVLVKYFNLIVTNSIYITIFTIMKNIIITSLFFLIALITNAQSFNKKELNTIKSFLTKFQTAAQNQNNSDLLKLIHPLEIKGKNLTDKIIKEIFESDENSKAHFAYSDRAMSLLIENYINDFYPITADLKEILYKNDEFKNVIGKLSDKQVAIFDKKDIHIIITLDGKNSKLLFWEKLNNLLK